MAMDAELKDLITTGLLLDHQESSRLTGMADRNLTQGLGVIHDTVIQSVGATADDAQLMAAMRTADRVPNVST